MSLIASVFVILGHRSYQRCSASTTEATDLMVFPQSNIDRRPSFVMPPGLSQAGKALDLYWARPVRKLVPPQTSEVVRAWRVSEVVVHSKPHSIRRAASRMSKSPESDNVGNGEAVVKRDVRTPQELLDSMSPERRNNPYEVSAGAPREKENSLVTNIVGAVKRRPPTALHSLYRRRKRPPFALCMPRHQRPQGCAPLLPMENQDAVVDHLASAEIMRAELSDFKSDLPCVQNGTCPVPAFRCPKGHVWESDGNPVCFYCPICADSRVTALGRERRLKRDLEMMKRLAEARGGACISKTYAGMHRKMRFRCAEGHEWLSTPANIAYRKTWCPTCADMARSQRKKLDVAEMQRTARQFGGEFLSTEYLGAAVKHEWKCRRGHRFWQTPSNIRRAEGGRRTATFCKKCTALDRSIIKASVLGGLDPESAMQMEAKLSRIGAMPTRRHFLPRRRKMKKVERQVTTKGGGSDSK